MGTGLLDPLKRGGRMNARALIWEAMPRKPAASLQYELSLRGRSVTYRQTKRIVTTGEIPKSLWGDVLDVLDKAMAQRREQIRETEMAIKLLRLERSGLKAVARMAEADRPIVPEIPGLIEGAR